MVELQLTTPIDSVQLLSNDLSSGSEDATGGQRGGQNAVGITCAVQGDVTHVPLSMWEEPLHGDYRTVNLES
jgi:hypothetical protein